jgi:transcriptional regulator with XRE-family HTH domain
MLDTKQILQDNLKALLATRPDVSRLNLSKEMKVGDGTLGLIQYGRGNPTVEILETIAGFFQLETWQLLSPSLGQSVVTNGNLHRWPFSSVKAKDFDALSREERDEIEYQITYKVKRFKANSTARKKT